LFQVPLVVVLKFLQLHILNILYKMYSLTQHWQNVASDSNGMILCLQTGSDEVESRPNSGGAVQRDKKERSAAMPACRSLALCWTGLSHSSTEVPVFVSCNDVVGIDPTTLFDCFFLLNALFLHLRETEPFKNLD